PLQNVVQSRAKFTPLLFRHDQLGTAAVRDPKNVQDAAIARSKNPGVQNVQIQGRQRPGNRSKQPRAILGTDHDGTAIPFGKVLDGGNRSFPPKLFHQLEMSRNIALCRGKKISFPASTPENGPPYRPGGPWPAGAGPGPGFCATPPAHLHVGIRLFPFPPRRLTPWHRALPAAPLSTDSRDRGRPL